MPGFVLKDNGGEISSQSISTVPQRNMSQRPKEQNKSPQLTEQMGNYWWRRPQQSKNTVSKNHICWHIQCFYQIILGNTPTFWFKLIFTQCVRQWRLIKCFLLILQEAFLQCKRQWGGKKIRKCQRAVDDAQLINRCKYLNDWFSLIILSFVCWNNLWFVYSVWVCVPI